VTYEAEDRGKGEDKSIYCRLIIRNFLDKDAELEEDLNEHHNREGFQGSDDSSTDETIQGSDDDLQLLLPLVESDDEPYEAVSWTWGGHKGNASIYIEDGKGWRTLEVRTNMIGVLRRLRRKDASRSVWVDQVCIWQANLYERNLQVAMMAHIYGNATSVCIWLGEHYDNSKLALDFIATTVSDLGVIEEITTTTKFSEEWTALGALMNRPWFDRRWIVQEISHAKLATVHCGEDSVSWTDFETAVSLFERDATRIAEIFHGNQKAEYSPDYFGDVQAMGATRLVQVKSRLFRRNDENQVVEYRYPLSDLVTELSSFESGDAHDMIYAVLSLAKDTHHRTEARDPSKGNYTSSFNSSPSAGTSRGHKRKHDAALATPSDDHTTAHGDAPPDETRAKRCRTDTSKHGGVPGETPAQESTTTKPTDYNIRDATLAKVAVNAFRKNASDAKKEHKVFQVDYNQPFFQVCKQFLDFCLRYPTGNNNLDILCRPWAPMIESSKLPSWIPTVKDAPFKVRTARFAPGGKQVARKNHDPLVCQSPTANSSASGYNACRNQKAKEWRFGDDKDGEQKFSLFVSGFVIDEIGEIQTFSQLGNIPVEWFDLAGWNPWDATGKRASDSYAPERLWRTLVADRGPNGENAKVYYPKAFEYAIDNSTPETGLETTNLAKRRNPILVEFLKRMMAVVWNRRLFKSEYHGGLLGLAPKKAQKSDGMKQNPFVSPSTPTDQLYSHLYT
jgi:hypothetical protein